jgi:hypothetical protein
LRREKQKIQNVVCVLNLSYLITPTAYLCSQRAPNVQIKYLMFGWSIYRLFVLTMGWKLECLQIIIFVLVSSIWGIVEIKTPFEPWITRKDVSGVNLYYLYYLITLTAYLYSQKTPNVQVNYCMLDWSIYWQNVLNSGWKRDSFQMILVNVHSTWSMVKLKTRFRRE